MHDISKLEERAQTALDLIHDAMGGFDAFAGGGQSDSDDLSAEVAARDARIQEVEKEIEDLRALLAEREEKLRMIESRRKNDLAELDEIMALSDRIAVLYKGQVIDTMPAEDATELLDRIHVSRNHLQTILVDHLVEKRRSQGGNVLAPLAKRRHVQGQDLFGRQRGHGGPDPGRIGEASGD